MNDTKVHGQSQHGYAIPEGYIRVGGFKRIDAQIVPGIGPIISVFILQGITYAIRNDGTEDILYSSFNGEWVKQ